MMPLPAMPPATGVSASSGPITSNALSESPAALMEASSAAVFPSCDIPVTTKGTRYLGYERK